MWQFTLLFRLKPTCFDLQKIISSNFAVRNFVVDINNELIALLFTFILL
jgi:hypothetical protein